MGRLSAMAGIGAAVLALSGEEADAQFGCSVIINDRWVHRNYVPFGYVGPMVFIHRGIPVGGNYLGGHFNTGRFRIDFSRYEAQPPFYPLSGVCRTIPQRYEEMVAPHYPRGVTEEDGEDELYRALDGMREPFRWKKYLKACSGEFIQVDAVSGRKIIDVVP